MNAFLSEMAIRAAEVGRAPTRTEFSADQRLAVAAFFRERKNGLRQQSFVALSRLLGLPLEQGDWGALFEANYVKDLAFLVGGDTVKGGNDWLNKCSGLKELADRVFVVGLNRHFFAHAEESVVR